jgi:outer membrane immunogenic protein
MRRILTFSMACLAAAASVSLAGPEEISKQIREETAPPPFSWEGAYIGLNAGGTFGTSQANDTRNYSVDVEVNNESASTWPYDASGFTGGIQWGYNWQCHHLVYGVETDLGYLNIEGDGSHTNDVRVDSSTNSDVYWATRGRLGWSFGRLLLYGTGGSITVNYNAEVRNPANGDHGSEEDLRYGWTGGGGIEYAFNDRWSLKGEYLYYELENGSVDLHSTRNVGGNTGVFQFDHQSEGHIVRLGVNYHFGAPTPRQDVQAGIYLDRSLHWFAHRVWRGPDAMDR